VADAPKPAFEPYIAAETRMAELTPRALIAGTVLGMVFGAASLYLVLKVGLTVSASIPVAVIAITLFRALSKLGFKDATVLENNIVQVAGSAGESIAFGLGVTMPAILILGADLEPYRPLLVSILGGTLGILMMIPLRRALIVQQHGKLKYPEGTACAEVLKAGASEESKLLSSASAKEEARKSALAGLSADSSARTIFAGFGLGLVYKSLMSAGRLWKEVPEKVFGPPLPAGSVSAEISPELTGVGYIIGPKVASIMVAGGVLSYLVLIPMIKFFGAAIPGVLSPGTMPIADMGPDDIRGAYILYIGAGAVVAGGIISLLRSFPLIWAGLREGLKDFRRGGEAVAKGFVKKRTDDDLSMKWVLWGCAGLVVAILAIPTLHMNVVGAILILAFGFLFVTVSSRLTGEVGSSSNPISGMTVATLLLTCLIFLALGWTGAGYFVTALSVGAIVCIASSNGGTTSQALKTGFLLGGTPRHQQVAILLGSFASCLILGPILLALNNSNAIYLPIAKVAPAGLTTNVAELHQTEVPKPGPFSQGDTRSYKVWFKTDPNGGPEGKYLVDDAGQAVYFMDPSINGRFTEVATPDGKTIKLDRFDAPKATLMSYIIKGILNRDLPWGLVLFGILISITLELSGVSALVFAVGLYLPLSTSSPIFLGGMIRWAIDRWQEKDFAAKGVTMTEEQLTAHGDKSPGVLMASGYIAGGALAGIVIAFLAAVPWFTRFNERVGELAEKNPFHSGAWSDLLALVPYTVLLVVLYLAGRELILTGRKKA
jgi:putative OPT family oligopeptide transporter